MGLFSAIFRKSSPPVHSEPERVSSQKEDQPKPRPVVLEVKSEWKDTEPVGALSVLDFGKPAGALGSLLNYEPRKLEEPTQKQLEYAKDLGLFIPPGATKGDVSHLLSRATGEDSMEGPGQGLVDMAAGLGLHFSACIGAAGLLSLIVYGVGERDRAALYAYCVQQSRAGLEIGNMLADPGVATFYGFADMVEKDPALSRSLSGREVDDFRKPHRGTAIYKAAAAFLAGGEP